MLDKMYSRAIKKLKYHSSECQLLLQIFTFTSPFGGLGVCFNREKICFSRNRARERARKAEVPNINRFDCNH